jgi:predicted HicB family RNase H-like nuclease
MDRSAVINMRTNPEIKAAAERAAEADGRSLSGWITWTLQQRLTELGYLDAKGRAVARPSKRG